jgi:HAD superfamily hydrolase (TIGR01549 family)
MKYDFTDNRFQAILFDFDGVLAECMNVKTDAFAQLFERYGDEVVKKVVYHHVKNGGISRYKKIQYYFSKYLKKEISDVELNKLANEFSDLVVTRVIQSDWVPGAKEFLEKYYKNIDLYVISGTPQEELKTIIIKRKMTKYFKGVYGSPTIKPVHIKQIIVENSYKSENVVYIGDSLSDYKDAMTAGVPFLGRYINGTMRFFPKGTITINDFTELL